MKIVRCSRIADFSNTFRKYYNLDDIRISDVLLYTKNDVHLYHKHNKITEILYILEGSIKAKIKENEIIKEIIINKNEIVIFNTNELHTVSSISDTSRILVFKYLSKNENLIDTFVNDFEDE